MGNGEAGDAGEATFADYATVVMGTHRWISVKWSGSIDGAEQLSQQGALVSPQQIEGLSEFEKRFDVGDAIDTCFAEVRALGWDDGKDNEFKFEDHHLMDTIMSTFKTRGVAQYKQCGYSIQRLFIPLACCTFLWALIIISISAAATSDDDDYSIWTPAPTPIN